MPFSVKVPRTMDALKQKRVPWDEIKEQINIQEEMVKTKSFGQIAV